MGTTQAGSLYCACLGFTSAATTATTRLTRSANHHNPLIPSPLPLASSSPDTPTRPATLPDGAEAVPRR